MTQEPRIETAPPQNHTPICAIGASAGGVTALQSFFRQVPDDLGIAYVVILHLAPDQPSALHTILSACTKMPVHQVESDSHLRPNCVYVIPPDRELVIDGDSVTARTFTEPRGRRAPIDMFFRSIASARGDGVAVILSGAGSDGSVGVRSVKEAGGVIMVQEPAEAGFPMMPQNAIATGAADFIGPIVRLVERLAEVAHSKEAVRSLDMDGAANDLRRIVAFLRTRTGHDFSNYKRATVMRRVLRRMQVCRFDTLTEYDAHLRATPEEAKELFSDLLISVTMFFRDYQAFEALEQRAIAPLFDTLDETGIRAWVVGCASGEEAYSIAILMLEEAARRKTHVLIQIFASDLDEGALATAREGRYPRSIEADVSDERLSRFFVDEGTHYRIRREVRDLVLFASHSVLKDPPFSRLDLVTCRNLLIYIERSLQQQICAIFHYGLKPNRFLFLGTAETADSLPDLFVPIDREARVYQARAQALQSLPLLPNLPPTDRFAQLATGQVARLDAGTLAASFHAAALESTAPPSALVDDRQEIVHLSPKAGRFILHSAGAFSNKLSSIVRPELRLDLRLALLRAFDHKLATLTHSASVNFEGEWRRIALYVTPSSDGRRTAQALVLFLDGGPLPQVDTAPAGDRPDEVRHLHAELKASHEALIESRSSHEGSVQELRAANEELQSINEEYRSTAEELETSKEELQSINEELQTVNAELKSKLESISVAHSDLQNLTAATEIGTLFLDGRLRIKMFTAPIADLFNVTANDVGRAINHFTHQLDYDAIEADVRDVIGEARLIEREVRSHDGRWYIMRLRPYRTLEGRVDGTVLTFVDITQRREAEGKMIASEARLRALVEASSQIMYRMSPDWTEMRELSGGGVLRDTGSPDRNWLEHYIPAVDQLRVTAIIREAIQKKGVFDLEHQVRLADGTLGWTHSRAVPLLDDRGRIQEWFGTAADITQHRRTELAVRDSEERQRILIEGVPQLVWRAVDVGHWTWASPQWTAYTGLSEHESLGLGWLASIHLDDRPQVMEAWKSAERLGLFEAECRILWHKRGCYRWFQARATPLRDPGNRIIEWLGTSTDVDDLRTMQESQAVMVAELQHRTRNLIAVVRSVAKHTMDTTSDLETFRLKFNNRLEALARVQGLLSHSEQERITIATLVRTELEALGTPAMQEHRIKLQGPEVQLRNANVQTLALGLHELATNATKYGALATDHGRLTVSWTTYEDPVSGRRLQLHWVEHGIVQPRESVDALREGGYGRELIERALPYALGARTSFELGDDVVRCSIDLPLGGRTD
ncbi:chemotaxis protein CheB [Lichenifustis flavocetrariae]|uniref:Blue-light-activated histidine kinase n=1 Tax=Lichenifustis flavocetrariae TaxID=2949735 RepID=A0AA41Z248_9HYPH|nr:chemotaxis protein CheB [Lichenifustis flavocetrariae]MCW6511587.1 PAS domain-containing protein [Lichenifustis flavocetrariae]